MARDFPEKRFLEVTKPPTQCTNTSAPTSICGPRVALPLGMNANCSMILHILDMQWGASTLMDYYWQCGEYAYTQLVPTWRGLCSLVTLHTPTLVIPGEELSDLFQHPLKKKTTLLHQDHENRTAEYYDSTQFKEIAEAFRLFTDAQLGAGGLYPSLPYKPKLMPAGCR